MFLGEDLLAWLTLAFGGALFVGNLLAIVKPPTRQLDDTNLERAPVMRSVGFAAIASSPRSGRRRRSSVPDQSAAYTEIVT